MKTLIVVVVLVLISAAFYVYFRTAVDRDYKAQVCEYIYARSKLCFPGCKVAAMGILSSSVKGGGAYNTCF